MDNTCTDCNELVPHCKCGLFVSNRGFWGRTADDRAAVMQAAAERGGVENFFDLPPDERAQAYDA